ncbi:MAG TPA: helix-turn-helix domain-containing protein, partial [Pirellulales bacterium]|nr:helix-turn-helix domain-containing protein [Pirellulales bacterium]
SWPGNVRQLQSTIKQAILRATAPILMVQDLPPELQPSAAGDRDTSETADELEQFINKQIEVGGPHIFEDVVATVKRQMLLRALRQTEGNQVHAAKVLGITRGTLRNEIRKLGIVIDRAINP